MTQETLNEIKSATDGIHAIKQRHATELGVAESQIRTLLAKCDHKNPDGSSAMQGQMFMNVCKICGSSDL